MLRGVLCLVMSSRCSYYTALLQGTLYARRKAEAVVRGDDVVHKLFTDLATRYKDREGGYTRILRSRIRSSAAAPMAYIEYDPHLGLKHLLPRSAYEPQLH